MANQKGYVILKGKADDLVPETENIYASPTLKSIIRRGKRNVEISGKAMAVTDVKEAYRLAKEQIEAAKKKTTKKINPLFSKKELLAPTINQEEIQSRLAKEIYNKSIEGYQYSSSAILTAIESNFSDISQAPNNINGGFTQVGISSKIKERYESVEKELEDKCNPVQKAANITKAVADAYGDTVVANIAKWFDEQEAIIDSLPTMSEMGEDVYEVETREVDGKKDWYYTGKHEPPDRIGFDRLQNTKANVCAKLTKMMNKVSNKINDVLTEQLNRLEKCKPFTTAMEVISSVPTLGSIIRWATSVIDFFIATYKLIYSLIKMSIQILELVIMRGPQLINKIMSKVTEFDCPVAFDIQINKKE